jgi:hypothetical protein
MSCQEQNHWLREWLCAIVTTQKPRNPGALASGPPPNACCCNAVLIPGMGTPSPVSKHTALECSRASRFTGGWGWVSLRQRCNDATLYGGPGWGLD